MEKLWAVSLAACCAPAPFLLNFIQLVSLRRIIIVPVGIMGPFQPGDNPRETVGELMGCVQGQQLSVSPSHVF